LINSVNLFDPNRVQIVRAPDGISNCVVQKIPLIGNAAGNFVNWTDLTGANTQVPQVNNGALYVQSKKRSRVFADEFEA
jgi:hypothetical protein